MSERTFDYSFITFTLIFFLFIISMVLFSEPIFRQSFLTSPLQLVDKEPFITFLFLILFKFYFLPHVLSYENVFSLETL